MNAGQIDLDLGSRPHLVKARHKLLGLIIQGVQRDKAAAELHYTEGWAHVDIAKIKKANGLKSTAHLFYQLGLNKWEPQQLEEREAKVNHPTHYNSGIPPASIPALATLTGCPESQLADNQTECIVLMRLVFGDTFTFCFCVGSAFKYLCRAGLKGEAETDYGKARWCLECASKLDVFPVFEGIQRRARQVIKGGLIP